MNLINEFIVKETQKGCVIRLDAKNYKDLSYNSLYDICVKIKNLGFTHLLFSCPIDIDVLADEYYVKVLKGFIDIVKNNGLYLWIRYSANSYSYDDPEVFLNKVKPQMIGYAKICKEYNIDHFVISNESSSLTSIPVNEHDDTLRSTWKTIIKEIKEVYPEVKIGMSMNYNEIAKSTIISQLDFVGYNAYIHMSDKGLDATLIECANTWYTDTYRQNHIKVINDIVSKYKIPVYITECGCQPYEGRLFFTGTSSGPGIYSKEVQAKFLEASLNVMLNEENIKGFFIFDVFGGGYNFIGNELAEEVITNLFEEVKEDASDAKI